MNCTRYLIIQRCTNRTKGKVKFAFCLLILGFLFSGCKQEEAKRPNILFAIADDASYPHMGAYGTEWVVTPAFDYVAKNGLLFERAYTTNAKCSPSRATILTGRNSWQLEEACNHMAFFPEKFRTFAEALTDAGYFVGHTGKGWAPGIAQINGQLRNLIGPAFNLHSTDPPASFVSSNDYQQNFATFLDWVPSDSPWFFWYGSYEPHRAYDFGVGLGKEKSLTDVEVPPYWPDTDTIRTDMLDYAYEIEYFDSHLDSMLKILDERGELENTLIVVTADNGMPFPRVKGQVYEMDHHLPLAMMWPQGIVEPGRRVNEFVSFSDFAPTFLEVAGIEAALSGMQPITGNSLQPLLFAEEDRNRPDFMLLGKERHDMGRPNDEGYPVRAIIKDDYLYSVNFKPDRWPAGNPETGYLNCDGSPTKTFILQLNRKGLNQEFWQLNFGKRPEEELYNLKEDPYCMSNLANEERLIGLKGDLKDLMWKELSAQADPRIMGNGKVFDEYPAFSESSDFYSRWLNGEKPPSGWVNDSDFEPVEQITN